MPPAAKMGGTAVDARGFGWTHFGRNTPALEGIDLQIAPGERVLLCGNSGSGKSTLLAALAGVLGGGDEGFQEGQLVIEDGRGYREAPGGQIPVGLVLQDPDSQVISARIGEDVAFGCENLGFDRDEIWRRVRQALDIVGLDLPLDHPTARLSGGQKQRLALAGVIAMGAGMILLDEPTANLDPAGAREVIDAVAQTCARTGATLVVVEHNYDHWDPVLDRAVVLAGGRIVEDGEYREIVAKRRVGGLPSALRPDQVDRRPTALYSEELVTRFGPPRTVSLPESASTVITGANGSGKTTWLMTMAGLMDSFGGWIDMSERLAQGLQPPPNRWNSRQLAHRIGYVFQNPEHQFVARSVICL